MKEEPPLRSGSFAGVMEEYAEGKLFYVWLLGRDSDEGGDDKAPGKMSSPSGILLQPDDLDLLEPDEYLGGLCDLTGEIGRFAVAQGTARNSDGVKRCLETNGTILTAIQCMEQLPGGVGKKVDQLRRSVEKLERMLYEMSLSEATGGRTVDAAEDMVVEGSSKVD